MKDSAKRPCGTVSRPAHLPGGALLLAGIVCLLLCSPVAASHNDSTPIGLRVTVTNVNPFTGTVDFDVTVVDDDIYGTESPSLSRPFTDIAIGRRFTQDRYTYYSYSQYVFQATNIVLPPAIDFGDSNTIPFTRLPLVGDPTSSPGTFRGSFSHSYTVPGVYTITAFVSADRASPNVEITTGNAVSGSMHVENLAGTISNNVNAGPSSFRGLTNTAVVTLDEAIESVPALSGIGLLALGAGIVLLGLVLVRRLA